MAAKKAILETERDALSFFRRLKNRDFSGTTGRAIHNSLYSSLTNVAARLGSLVFMIFLARVLMPELFGLYALVLSTLLLFVEFSNFGIWEALVVYISKEIGRNRRGKAKGYFLYLSKLKIVFALVIIVVLFLSARFIAETYYQKPILLALFAGGLYILSLAFVGISKRAFQSLNLFKRTFHQEVFYQVLRLLIVPLFVLLALRYNQGDARVLFWLIVGISLANLVSLIIFVVKSKEIYFLRARQEKLTPKNKKELTLFLAAISASSISATFFTSIDTIILGRFVSAAFIGYYAAAFSLMGAAISIITFSSALLPVYSGLEGKRLSRFFRKSTHATVLLSLLALVVAVLFAPLLIRLVFGSEYAPAIAILRFFSVILVIVPLISIASTYLISMKKPFVVTLSKVFSTLINIVLSYILITKLLVHGEIFAIYGTAIATVISNVVHLSVLLVVARKFSR